MASQPKPVHIDLRAMVYAALDAVGGEKYLEEQAGKNPTAYMALMGKCLPREIIGGDGAPMFPDRIEIVCVEAARDR